jgi:hypothetical protein
MVVRDQLLQMLNGVEYRTFNKTNKEEEAVSELELIPGVAP